MTGFVRRHREDAERLERELLAPAATLAEESKGRLEPEPPDPDRTAFELDRDRITHSKAFRRLKHKTQVFINPADDHFVTRMTHTIQVTQIGRAVARYLGLNETLTEAVCLGHDVGHAPFGHIGEDALSDYVDRQWLHSEQGLRIFSILEPLNLTWEVQDGIRAHSWRVKPPPATPEGMLCRYADRIAYLTHDVGDATHAGIIAEADLPVAGIERFGPPGGGWVGVMIDAVVGETVATGQVSMEATALAAMNEVRDFMFERVYLRPEMEDQKRRVYRIIHDLVDHFREHPEELPEAFHSYPGDVLARVVDYVSGMTDRYALRMHAELFPA